MQLNQQELEALAGRIEENLDSPDGFYFHDKCAILKMEILKQEYENGVYKNKGLWPNKNRLFAKQRFS